MTRNKLSKKEIDTILTAFDWSDLSIRSFWRQSRLFQACFLFVNLYVVLYILTARWFPDLIFTDTVTMRIHDDYARLLSTRALIGLILIFLFNVTFFLTNNFRFVALVGFSYLLNATLDFFTIFAPFFDLSQFNLAVVFYWLRPVSLAAMLTCILVFDPEF